MKTPKTSGRLQLAHAEMHPSKVQQSTKKLSDSTPKSGLRKSMGLDGAQDITPSRSKGEISSQPIASPNVDFPFASEDSQLSSDARKLMDRVREDAARIKAQMVLGKNEQDKKDGEAENLLGGRKIAQAKGKAGRFSQAHMAEFKKMDSIAGHPSSYRTQPGRIQTPVKSLKRTNSKACLDEPEKRTPKSTDTPKRDGGNSAVHTTKRARKSESDDASACRPPSRNPGGEECNTSNNDAKPKRRLPVATKTPTRAARFKSASVKNSKTTSTIPSPTRSPSAKHTAAPQTPKTEFNPKMKSGIPTLGNLKSILRRHQPLFSTDPVKIAAGTHIASPNFDFNKNLLHGAEASNQSYTTPSVKKHVDFTSSTKSPNDHADASPSPSKGSAPANVAYPSLPALYPSLSSPSVPAETEEKEPPKSTTKRAIKKPATPTIRRVQGSDPSPGPKAVPNIPAVPHGIANKKRRRDQVNDEDDTENKTPAEISTPDGRDHKRVKANPAVPTQAATPSPIKMRPLANVTPRRGTPSRAPGRTPGSTRQKNKGILSMSRLNMLSQPKERR